MYIDVFNIMIRCVMPKTALSLYVWKYDILYPTNEYSLWIFIVRRTYLYVLWSKINTTHTQYFLEGIIFLVRNLYTQTWLSDIQYYIALSISFSENMKHNFILEIRPFSACRLSFNGSVASNTATIIITFLEGCIFVSIFDYTTW